MSTRNNKIAFLEAQNIKINDFNNKMYELCKKSGVFEKLEAINVNELESQKQVYEPSKDTKQRYCKKPKNTSENRPKAKSLEHC